MSEGKTKLPHCGLIILGKERSGKTSLYRQLVGKEFRPDLDSTRGINNEEIDALADNRSVEADLEWQEKEFDNYVDAVQDELYKAGLVKPSISEVVSETSILEQLSNITSDSPPSDRKSVSRLKSESHDSTIISDFKSSPPIEQTTIDPKFPVEEKVSQNRSFHTVITEKQVLEINAMLTQQKLKQKELSLSLNVLDFAGQKQYWPMHRCFLSRRALYLLVFKIPDMLAYINNPLIAAYNPLEDICYWLRSIHAHIKSDHDEKFSKQVLLVGTHLGAYSHENLQKIDKFLMDEVIMAKNQLYARHVHSIDESNTMQWFMPVENSIDINRRPQTYLQESGAKLVQDKVKELSELMPFLKEEHPIKWIKLEQLIFEAGKLIPIMTMAEVIGIVEQCAITSREQQKLTLQFFNLTGKIICLGKH